MFIVHFISNFITSAPPQIIMQQILEVGDPCSKAVDLNHKGLQETGELT